MKEVTVGTRSQDTFRWKCMDGRVMTLGEMATGHIFNSMKMCFNHLAQAQGGTPIWFTKQYTDYGQLAVDEPKYLAALTIFFIREIERRGDLPENLREPYIQITSQIFPGGIESNQLAGYIADQSEVVAS